ncbi:MAG: outer membrane protein transport protein [Marinibacterium sp.]|nr:outer membrane protein transport protein [Marinibacterium sp.]
MTGLGLVLCTVSATAVSAGGLDRTGQSVGLLFESGNYAEFSIGRANPDLTGNDVRNLNPFGTPTGDVGHGFNQVGAGIKYDINDKMSVALIYDQPWGSDISYPEFNGNPTTPGSLLLGGTEAISNSDAFTGLLRYKFNDNWSAHGGLRYQQIDGNIALSGLAYGPTGGPGFNGYSIDLAQDGAFGFVVGGAYEIPDIAMRVAVTYSSEIEHEFNSTERFGFSPLTIAGEKKVKTPQSLNLDFQTGIAANTLLIGNIRWAEHSVVNLDTTSVGPLPSVNLIDIDDSWTFNLGVARRFNENWAGTISFGHETERSDNLVSPLAPTNGFNSVALGVQYTQGPMRISGGVRYALLGDAFAETGTPDVARAEFKNNDVVSFGVRVGFSF